MRGAVRKSTLARALEELEAWAQVVAEADQARAQGITEACAWLRARLRLEAQATD